MQGWVEEPVGWWERSARAQYQMSESSNKSKTGSLNQNPPHIVDPEESNQSSASASFEIVGVLLQHQFPNSVMVVKKLEFPVQYW
jgi:hypothetical protein